MATTFGIKAENEDEEEIKVAHQHGTPNGVHIKFVHPNPDTLPDDMVIVPLDNGGAPITVGEVRKQIKEQDL